MVAGSGTGLTVPVSLEKNRKIRRDVQEIMRYLSQVKA
jgi:hypothetical protein